MSTRRSTRIPAEIGRMADLRAVVREVADACSASPGCQDDLLQAVDEAATNIVLHGYRGAPGWIEVTAERAGDDLVITLEDAAPTFDPTALPAPDLETAPERRRPGGMGVHLMRAAMGTITHRPRPGGGNILTMTRRLDTETAMEATKGGTSDDPGHHGRAG